MSEEWEQTFVGRENELQSLKEAYRCAVEGNPQLVTLLAETGLGKTRLAQELFNWLSSTQDALEPDGYWPDRLESVPSPQVNPTWRRGFNIPSSATIPFLWWGLRWDDPQSARQSGFDSALAHYAAPIRPHLLRALLEREGRVADRETVKEAGGILRDSVGALLNQVTLGASGTIAGVWGAVENSASLVQQVRDRRQSHARAELRPEIHYEESLSELSNELFEHLQMLLSSSEEAVPTVPVIILLDDAHWALGDRDTLGFLEHLLTEAAHQHWPLLVVATHWQHLWHEQKGQEATFRNFCDELPASVEQIHLELDLMPAESAVKVVKHALPGIAEEHHVQLVKNCGGNMLLIVQMIKLIVEAPRNFENHHTSSALSRVGQDAVNGLEHADLYQVVHARFRQLGSLSEILCCAALQGPRFLVPLLAETLTVEVGTESFQDALARAETPHELIDSETVGRESLSFAEPIHHRVALDFLKEDWQSYARMQERLARTIVSWVKNRRCFGLVRGDRALFFKLAKDILAEHQIEGAAEAANFCRDYLTIIYLHGGLSFGLEQLAMLNLEVVDARIAKDEELLQESFLTQPVGFSVATLRRAAQYLPDTHRMMIDLLHRRSDSEDHARWILSSQLDSTALLLRYIEERDRGLYTMTLDALKAPRHREAFIRRVLATPLDQTSFFLQYIEERDRGLYTMTLDTLKEPQYREAFIRRVLATPLDQTSFFLQYIEERDVDVYTMTLDVLRDERYQALIIDQMKSSTPDQLTAFIRACEAVAILALATRPAHEWLNAWQTQMLGDASKSLGILKELQRIECGDLAAGLADQLVEQVDPADWDKPSVFLHHAVKVLSFTSHRGDDDVTHFATTVLTPKWVDTRYAMRGTGWGHIAGAINGLWQWQGPEFAEYLITKRLHKELDYAASRLITSNPETLFDALQLIGACALIDIRPVHFKSPRRDVLAKACARITPTADEHIFGYTQMQFTVGLRQIALGTQKPLQIPADFGDAMLEAWETFEIESDNSATLKKKTTRWLKRCKASNWYLID